MATEETLFCCHSTLRLMRAWVCVCVYMSVCVRDIMGVNVDWGNLNRLDASSRLQTDNWAKSISLVKKKRREEEAARKLFRAKITDTWCWFVSQLNKGDILCLSVQFLQSSNAKKVVLQCKMWFKKRSVPEPKRQRNWWGKTLKNEISLYCWR